jgi:hypothetical protein
MRRKKSRVFQHDHSRDTFNPTETPLPDATTYFRLKNGDVIGVQIEHNGECVQVFSQHKEDGSKYFGKSAITVSPEGPFLEVRAAKRKERK